MMSPRRNAFSHLAKAAVFAVAVAFGAAGQARADLILQYFEGPSIPPSAKPFVLTTNSPTNTISTFSSTPIEVKINLPTLGLSNIIGFMQFQGVSSVGNISVFGSNLFQNFTGTVRFNSNSTFTGINYLTAIFTDPGPDSVPAVLNSSTPTTGSLSASSAINTDTLSFTSDVLSNIIHGTEDMSLAFNNIEPPSGAIGTTFRPFKANGSGTFGAEFEVVPEPSTLLGATIAGLIAFRLRRRRTVA